jgi:hypothetical protein
MPVFEGGEDSDAIGGPAQMNYRQLIDALLALKVKDETPVRIQTSIESAETGAPEIEDIVSVKVQGKVVVIFTEEHQ